MALVPPNYLDAVGVLEETQEVDDVKRFEPVATGTLLAYEAPDQSEAGEDEVVIQYFLATNRHVIEGKTELWIRFNQGSGSKRFRIAVTDEHGNSLFFRSDKCDVAVTAINAPALKAAGADFDGLPERALLDSHGLSEKGVVGGDSVFVLGFPMGIAGTQRKYAIVRGGVVARVDEEIIDETNAFLIDCPVFPGNSGGPVILPPAPIALGGEEPRKRTYVIGIVSSYVPYIDVAISQQTQQPRITFEENSGLTNVVPMDAVNELVKQIRSTVDQGRGLKNLES